MASQAVSGSDLGRVEPVGAGAPRRILFVSPYFPPYAPVGAVRMPKLVKHWCRTGAKVSVLAIENLDFHGALARDEDEATVAYLPYRAGQSRPVPPSAAATGVGQGRAPDTRKPSFLKRVYRQIQLTPDRYRGLWVDGAAREGVRMAGDIDLIYSSGPPQSGHIAAARIAKATGKPWIAELRDLWAGNPYDDELAPIKWWSDRMADRTLSQATAFVTVTEGFAAYLRKRFGKPVQLSYNGFDPEDFAGLDAPAPLDPNRLTIIHAGVVYAGRRDPSALFEAMARLGEHARRISAIFHHDEGGFVTSLAERYGVSDQVEMRPLVPRREILEVERRADVLLICRWADPREDGVIPGKVFEYIGARRPILSVGSETGEAAAIIRDGGFGLVSNDPARIAEQLHGWIAGKDANGGRVPDLSGTSAKAYDRTHQFEAIDSFMLRLRH